MKYRREIDGLRAIAVVPVVLFHAGVPWSRGGFVGVDIFFVISGYLITTLLLEELRAEKFSILRFYERRARRILPALTFVVLCTIPPALLLLSPDGLKDFVESIVGVATFSSNIVFWLQADYFDTASGLKPLLHTWSLAVEEQYYVLFPPLLALLWRFGRLPRVSILAAGTLVSLALGEWLAHAHPTAAFYLLPTRAWELGIGALLAEYFTVRPLPKANGLADIAALAGVLLVVCAILAFDDSTPFPGLYALLPTIGTALIIAFAVEGTFTNRVLSIPPIVWIGLVSYSLYLWHQPLFAIARLATPLEPPPWSMATLAVASVVLAGLSWRFVETPFRRRNIFSRAQIFAMAGACTVSLLGIGGALHFVEGPISRWSAERFKPHLLQYDYDNAALQAESWRLLRRATRTSGYGVDRNPADRLSWFDPSDPRSRLLLIGNSHAKDIYNTLAFSKDARAHFQLARFGIQIADIPGDLFASPNYAKADVIVIASRYTDDDIAKLPELANRLRRDGKLVVLIRSIHEFRQHEAKQLTLADVAILKAIRNDERDGAAIQRRSDAAYFADFRSRSATAAEARSDAAISRLSRTYPDVVVLDRMDYVCDKAAERCFSMDRRLNKFFYDRSHQSLAGSRFFGERIDRIGWLGPIESGLGQKRSGGFGGARKSD